MNKVLRITDATTVEQPVFVKAGSIVYANNKTLIGTDFTVIGDNNRISGIKSLYSSGTTNGNITVKGNNNHIIGNNCVVIGDNQVCGECITINGVFHEIIATC